jgi:hypothetical protein
MVPPWLQALGSGAGGFGFLRSVFKVPADLPVCKTRIVREAHGFPWNEQVGVHPLKDGKLEITRIRANPQPPTPE